MAELSALRRSISAIFGASISPTAGIDVQGIPSLPADHGLKGWSTPTHAIGTGALMSTLGAGVLHGSRVRRVPAGTITNLHMIMSPAGATLSNCFAALFASNGTLLGVTADQSAAWLTVGYKTMPLVTPANHSGGDLLVGAWYNGTTAPSPLRAGGTTGAPNIAGQSADFDSFTFGTGLTTTPPASVAAAIGQGNICYWFGVS